MISIAPATHSFGPINTEHEGNATLFIGNPTFADAEWSLWHVPAPPPKHRFSSNTSNGHSVKGSNGAPPPVGDREGEGGIGSPNNGGVKLPPPRRAGSCAKMAGAGAGSSVGAAVSVYVDDPSVFRFTESRGVVTGVKLPLPSAAACLPEDWNRLEVRAKKAQHQQACFQYEFSAGVDRAACRAYYTLHLGFLSPRTGR